MLLALHGTRSTQSEARVIVAGMGPFARFAWPLLLLAACGDDPAYQSLGTLCADLAEDICDARAGCCMAMQDCVSAETARCRTQLDPLTDESSLRYNARDAAETRRTARMQLDTCGAPPALASFFRGGLADGAACERDAQCSGGACSVDTRVCATATPALCLTP